MKKVILFLSVMTLFLSSCEIFSSLSEKTGAISIKMPEDSERIAETYDVNEITSFTAELYDSGSSPVTKVSSTPGKSITFESLTPGSYAIVIKAFISAECAAYAEKSGIVVEAGATTYETITLFKNIIKNIESVEIAKESLDKITKNYTVGQTFALPDNVSIIAHFIHGYEKELEPNDYEIYICNAEKYTEETLVENQPLSENSRFAVIGICTESGYKYSAPVSLLMNAEEPVVSWTIPTVNDNTISFTISASASGEISYTWEKAKTADMAGKTACTSEIEIASDGTVSLPLKDASGNYIYYLCTVTNKNIVVNGATTASRQTDVFGGQIVSFDARYTGEYEVSGQLDNITAFEITETYADGYVLNIQSLPVNYKLAYAENLSNPEQLVGNIPLVITNLAAFDDDGKNLTQNVTVPFKYSFEEGELDFVIKADDNQVENPVTIAQYTGTITLSASNSLPEYNLYDNETITPVENKVSYAWYEEKSTDSSLPTEENLKVGNLESDVTYYCVQTIASFEPDWYVLAKSVQKSIEIKTEPWIIKILKDDVVIEGTTLDLGTYCLRCTNSCAKGDERISFKVEDNILENNEFTVQQENSGTNITITAYINEMSVASQEYTIPQEYTITRIVTFNLNYDGCTNITQSVINKTQAEEPNTVPVRDGYVFAGWYTDTEYTGKYDFSTVVTEDITLYAKWIEVITKWSALSAKLNEVEGDVGDIYISGDFDVTSKIIFDGTANIISTGNGVTFSRNASYTSDFFSLYPASLTFKGSESAPIVFDGKNIEVASLITNGGTTTFEYCSFKNNSSSLYASVYLPDGYTYDTTFKFCSFTGNKGPKGGTVYVGTEDKVCFENCRFENNTSENNTSSSDGGAVYIAKSATGTFSDCIFGNAEDENLGNYCTGATGGGGAVYATGASITLSNCEFYYNKATGDCGNGGGIGADSSSTVTITVGCIFNNNETALVDSSSTHGGALYISKSSLVLPNSGNIFENNREGNKAEHILSDIYIVSSGTLGTVNGTVYDTGSYTVAENGSLTPTSTSQ